jgi:hypothetical protein
MKKIHSVLFILFFIVAFLLDSCGKACIEARYTLENAGLLIDFFNEDNNQYFYPEDTTLSPYQIDSLRIKDSEGNLLQSDYTLALDPRNPLKKFNEAYVYPIFIDISDRGSYNNEQTKLIYLRYNNNTFDTLKLTFKAKKEKCGSLFQYIRIYYKDNLLLEDNNSLGPFVITLNHKQ